jgi:hypothetical protein
MRSFSASLRSPVLVRAANVVKVLVNACQSGKSKGAVHYVVNEFGDIFRKCSIKENLVDDSTISVRLEVREGKSKLGDTQFQALFELILSLIIGGAERVEFSGLWNQGMLDSLRDKIRELDVEVGRNTTGYETLIKYLDRVVIIGV